MGRNRHGRRKRNRPENFDQTQKDKFTKKNREQGEWYNYSKFQNDNFIKYYQGQGFIKDEEWDAFLQILKSSLPVTFRVTGCRSQAQEVLNIIKGQYFSSLSCVELDGKSIEPPKCLPWYPDGMAWQINLSRKEIRRHDVLKRLHEFMVSETESIMTPHWNKLIDYAVVHDLICHRVLKCLLGYRNKRNVDVHPHGGKLPNHPVCTGNISRQEGVSMIPPLLLDVKPHHKVLDMCAAPGSKTAQLIESLHSDETVTVPEGFVVANDRDNKRCYLMVHQVKRIQSPNVVIVNHDATLLPNLKLSEQNEKPIFVQYDRVLVDVPCSGDGTMRKNPDVWRTWSPNNGVNLHDLQFRILKRGLELLSVGGRLVYSTCSFNPVENEAVVGTMLRKCEGSVKLLDVSDKLPGLKFINGLTSWKIMNKKGEWISSFEDLNKQQQNQFKQSIFPPPKDELDAVNIQRCVRILPHHQNTGGFFIAVMEKTTELPWKKSPSQTSADQTTTTGEENGARKKATGKKVTGKKVTVLGRKKSNRKKNECTEVENGEASMPSHASKSEGEKTVASPELETEDVDKKKRSPENSVDVEDPPPKRPKVEESAKGNSQTTEKTDNKQKGKNERFGYKEDPFIFLDKSDAIWPSLQNFYDIPEKFPVNQLMYRCETGTKRNFYFVSTEVRRIAVCNRDRVKFINMGVKVLSKSPSPLVPDCDFRISQEGLNAMHNYLPGRQIKVTKDDVVSLLKEENPLVETFNESTQQEMLKLSPGSTIFYFKPSESDPLPNCDLVMCGWRGKTSMRSFVKQNDRFHYLRLCGVDPYEIKQKEKEMKEKLLEIKEKAKNKGNIHMSASDIVSEDTDPAGMKQSETSDSDKDCQSDKDVESVSSDHQDDDLDSDSKEDTKSDADMLASSTDTVNKSDTT